MFAMRIPMRGAMLAMALVFISATVVVAFDGYNGLPRPSGMDQAPTTTYGPKPAVKYENKVANCIWYGWENGNYPPDGTHNCSTSLWASLSASNPAGLAGYMYYVPLEAIYFDPMYNEYLCAIGCFDLTASGPSSGPVQAPNASPPVESPPPTAPVAAPPVNVAPPPVETISPPSPGALVPPPVEMTSPPSPGILVPPPATLFRPPPPAPPLPPVATPTIMVVPPIASESAPSPAMSPEISPVTSPVSSPILSPFSSPVPVAGGPGLDAQVASAATASVSIALVFTATLFLCMNFLF